MRPDLRSDPILTIEVAAHGAVRFRWADDTVLDLDGTIDYDRDSFERTLASCRRTLGSLVSSVEATAAAVRVLTTAAEQMMIGLVGSSASKRVEIERRFDAVLRPTMATTAPVGVVEVLGDHDYFPFELMPLFPPAPERWESYADIEQHLARFLGYSFVIRHVPRVSVTSAPLERASSTGSLPVQFVHFESTGAIKELEQLTAHPVGLAIDGPWPAPNATRTAVIESLTSAIHDPSRSLLGDRGEICQVQHFACHCNTQAPLRPQDFELVLGSDGSRHRVSAKAIHDGILALTRTRELRVARPLVFLNGCGSARSRMTDPLCFPVLFLSNGARGFVGTQSEIPDEAAAEFSSRFYDALHAGLSVGAAIVHARIALYRDFGNLLGLFYVLYGDPGITIR